MEAQDVLQHVSAETDGQNHIHNRNLIYKNAITHIYIAVLQTCIIIAIIIDNTSSEPVLLSFQHNYNFIVPKTISVTADYPSCIFFMLLLILSWSARV